MVRQAGLCFLMMLISAVAFSADTPPVIPGAEYFFGQDANDRNVMCVIQKSEENQEKVSFSVWNGMPFPITIMFRPKFENMNADSALPLVKEIPPHSTVLGYSARRIDRHKRHSWYNDWTWKIGPFQSKHDDSVLYSIPFPKDNSFHISQGYEGRWSHSEEFTFSIDWEMPIGTPVLAARDAVVFFVRDNFAGHSNDPSWKQRTNTITLLHSDGTMAEYSHIMQHSARVRAGDKVRAGDTLALSADVGYSMSPHLHFRVFRNRDSFSGEGEESIPVFFRNSKGEKINPGRR